MNKDLLFKIPIEQLNGRADDVGQYLIGIYKFYEDDYRVYLEFKDNTVYFLGIKIEKI